MEKEEKEEKKEFMVIIPEHVAEMMKELPEEVKKEFDEVIEQLQKDPIGMAEALSPCDIKLVCGECESRDMVWLVGDKTKEVSYWCNSCGIHAWMTWDEYQQAIKDFPELIYDYGEKIKK